ncbi:MAG: aminopeptidase P N-terminal domain-containing protein [Candidatus Margulisiibacteriota bacterium]|jgi:hypothetical protein
MLKNQYSKVFIDSDQKEKAKELYFQRRKAFAQKFDFPIVIMGAKACSLKYAWDLFEPSPIFQEPAMLFFTGINQTDIAILLDASQSNYQEILFLPQKSQKKEFWEGFYFGISTEKENKK